MNELFLTVTPYHISHFLLSPAASPLSLFLPFGSLFIPQDAPDLNIDMHVSAEVTLPSGMDVVKRLSGEETEEGGSSSASNSNTGKSVQLAAAASLVKESMGVGFRLGVEQGQADLEQADAELDKAEDAVRHLVEQREQAAQNLQHIEDEIDAATESLATLKKKVSRAGAAVTFRLYGYVKLLSTLLILCMFLTPSVQ